MRRYAIVLRAVVRLLYLFWGILDEKAIKCFISSNNHGCIVFFNLLYLFVFLSCPGYFDVRDQNEQWIRIAVKIGGMIVLRAGMYHRFTLVSVNYIKVF